MSAKIMGGIWDLDLPHNKMIVLLAMADHASHDGKNVFPSIGLIAWKTGYSYKQVQRIQKDLVSDGLLIPADGKRGKVVIYSIDLSKGKHKPPYDPGQNVLCQTTPDKMSDQTFCPPKDVENGQNVQSTSDMALPKNDIEPSLNRQLKEPSINTPAPIGAVIPTQPTKVADFKTKPPAVKAVKAKIPSYPRSVNSWEWCHLERFASENPNVNALAALPDSMRKCLKELSTAIVARHCVTLYQELQRNKVTAERYSSLYQVGKDRAKADEKWDIFQHMLWALPKWLDGNGSQPTITLIDDPTPVKPRSMEELRALAAEMRREKAAS